MSYRSMSLLLWLGALAQGVTGCDAPPADPPPALPPGAVRLATGTVHLVAGEEKTVCVTGKLPTTAAIDVIRIETQQVLSHHVILYRYTQGMAPTLNDKPTPCQALELLGGGSLKVPIFIAESERPEDNRLDLPPGVAYNLPKEDFYTLEAHLFNASLTERDAQAEVILTPAPEGSQPLPADMMFYNSVSGLKLPPMQETTIAPAFVQVSEHHKIFALTTHTHSLGTQATVTRSTSADVVGEPLYTNTDWQHPQLLRYPDAAPLRFQPGEGLRWQCAYNNPSSRTVKFGQSALTDEMCIVWAYYYPSAGFEVAWK